MTNVDINGMSIGGARDCETRLMERSGYAAPFIRFLSEV